MGRSVLVLVVLAIFAGPLLADPKVTLYYDTSRWSSSFPSGVIGGEYMAAVGTGWTYDVVSLYSPLASNQTIGLVGDYDPSFQTFCIERWIGYTPGKEYEVTLSDTAIYGGYPDPGDPISVGTAYLYYQFATGNLTGYKYTYIQGDGTRTSTARDLQEAIWILEEETSGTIAPWLQTTLSSVGTNLSDWQANNSGRYPVKAMSLHGSPIDYQDQLVLVPVPVPATILLGLLGLGYAGTKLRKLV